MAQYIDKATVVAEIENLKGEYLKHCKDKFYGAWSCGTLDNILSFLDTLEVKEVDLDKEIDNIWNPRFNLGWNEKSLLSMNHEGFTTIAKHFFELGLKAQKGE